MAELETSAVDIEIETADQTDAKETEKADVDVDVEVARLKAELARQKAALDKATKEAAENKRALRAKQSAEEAAAEEAKEAAEAQARELAELRKRFAVAETSKKVMAFVGKEEISNKVAEYLYGAEDVDAAITIIQKAWAEKEKLLRTEYGKIPSPGVGSPEGPTITREQLDAMSYMQRLEFAQQNPDEYERLMGRK